MMAPLEQIMLCKVAGVRSQREIYVLRVKMRVLRRQIKRD